MCDVLGLTRQAHSGDGGLVGHRGPPEKGKVERLLKNAD